MTVAMLELGANQRGTILGARLTLMRAADTLSDIFPC
jgi:hypothetical protein